MNFTRRRRSVYTLLALLLCFGTLLYVESAIAQTAKRVALLVGNAAYENEKPLRNPVNDAQAIAAVLRNDLGFTDVRVLPNVKRRELIDAVARFGEAARGADAAVFYFSGHGQQQNKANFLLPVDASIQRPEHVKAEGLDADDVLAVLEAAQPRVSLMILDACRDNPFAARTRSSAKGLGRPRNPEEGTLIAFATRDGDVAQDGAGNNSPYASALVQGLRQAKTTPIQQMFDVVNDQVRQATNGIQRPTRYGDLKVNVYLVNPTITINNNTSPSPVAHQRDAEEEAYKAAIGADVVEGYEQYLRDFEKGRNASAVKIRLAAAKRREAPAPQPATETRPPQSLSPDPLGDLMRASAPQPTARRAGEVFKDCADCPELVVIPGGSFTMGSNDSDDEKLPHSVSIKSFAMGKTEVTQGQWKAVMGSNPSKFTECGDACPVDTVSWNDAQQYIVRLNAKTGKQYRLPSESEWEYAARGGTSTKWSHGDNEGELGNYGWSSVNSGGKTHAVGQKRANPYGLNDMHGNVWEWMEDCWHRNYSGAPADGSAWTTSCRNNERVLRGGSWNGVPVFLRSAIRNWGVPVSRDSVYGFRIARTF